MAESAIKVREKVLMPVYLQVARQFADMHDTPTRMFQKGVLDGVVPWNEARRFFAARLKRRLREAALVRHVALTDEAIKTPDAIAMVNSWYCPDVTELPNTSAGPSSTSDMTPVEAMWMSQMVSDGDFLSWVESTAGRVQIAAELKALRSKAASRLVMDMLGTTEGKEGLLKALNAVLANDGALATQLRVMLASKSSA